MNTDFESPSISLSLESMRRHRAEIEAIERERLDRMCDAHWMNGFWFGVVLMAKLILAGVLTSCLLT